MAASEKLFDEFSKIMNNFQVKHGQCDSIIFPQNIFFRRLQVILKARRAWAFALLTAGFFTFDRS